MYLQTQNPASSAASISLPKIFHDELNYEERQHQKILDQIELAFKKLPTKANVLPGERLIKQGAKGRRTSLFPSRKAGGSIPLESQLELAHAVWNLERTAKNYRSQAIRIELPGGKCCYPDFVVLTYDGVYEVHEVKPDILHLDDDTIRKLKVVERIFNSIGIPFKIIDSSTLPSMRQAEDLLLIYARGHVQHWTAYQIELAIHLLQTNFISKLSDGHHFLLAHDLPAQLLEYLIFHELVSLPSLQQSNFGKGV